MRSVISTLIGLFLYAQVICGDSQCQNEYWLRSTQSSSVLEGHTHEIPEVSEAAVVFAYHEDCLQCICTMAEIVDGGGSFVDVTDTGVKGIVDFYEKRKNLYRDNPKESHNEITSSGKLYPELPQLPHCLYPSPKRT